MPSTYNAFGTELMVTGEKSGQWGTITNTNWNIIQQAVGGYLSKAVSDGGTTALAITDGSTATSEGRNMILNLTGALTSTSTVTVPDSVEKMYLVNNATTGSQTVTFKTATGTGVNFTATGYKLLYSDGTNVIDSTFGAATPPGGSDTQLQYNSSSAFGGASGLTTDGSNLNILTQGDLRLQDASGGQYVAQQASTTTSTYTVTWPNAAATSNDQILTSTTGGVLSWVDNSGGTSWQSVETGATFTAVAGNGYPVNTTAQACTATLPAGTAGDEVSFIDYARTFDTNNLTVASDGTEKIYASTDDLTVSIEGAAFTLVYVDSTQGWLLKDK